MTEYRLIARDFSYTRTFTEAKSVAAQMLGKRISNFMVIKSDVNGDRLIPINLSGGDVFNIERMCELA